MKTDLELAWEMSSRVLKKRKENQNQKQTNPLKQRTASGQCKKLGLYAGGCVGA